MQSGTVGNRFRHLGTVDVATWASRQDPAIVEIGRPLESEDIGEVGLPLLSTAGACARSAAVGSNQTTRS